MTESGTTSIGIVNADGSGGERQISTDYANTPVWSPDGTRILYNAPDYLRLFMMNRDGSGLTPVTDRVYVYHEPVPAWSPDGKSIAFVGWTGIAQDIYAINPDGSSLVRLTTNPGRQECP